MISDVANQKKDRRDESYNHAYHMTAPGPAPDEVPTSGDEDGAHKIKRGIDAGQVRG